MRSQYSRLTGQQVSALLLDHIERYSESYPTPQSVEETKALWNEIVADDVQLHQLLVKMMASSGSLLDINVAGETGIILASSNPPAVRTPMQRRENFETWGEGPLVPPHAGSADAPCRTGRSRSDWASGIRTSPSSPFRW